MRWVVYVAVLAVASQAVGQERQLFELPFAERPPKNVAAIMAKGEQTLAKEMGKIFGVIEAQLETELTRFMKSLDAENANFTQATLDVFRPWLIDRLRDRVRPSPVGTWKHKNRSLELTLYRDNTGKTNFHKFDVLWAQDCFGSIRVIYAHASRGIYTLKLNDDGTELVVTAAPDGIPAGEVWVRKEE